jgi:hypothetical protein
LHFYDGQKKFTFRNGGFLMKIGKVMKASSKLLAILASSFLLFGTIACSSDDDEEPGTVSPTSQPGNGGD